MECKKCPYYDYGLGGQYCDKVGGKTLLLGYCEDAYLETLKHVNYSKQKRRNKRERDQKHRNRMKFLSENISGYLSPVIYMDEIYVKRLGWVKIPKPYYKKTFYGTNCKRYYKRHSNKCVRQYKKGLHNGCSYKKVFDYKWTID